MKEAKKEEKKRQMLSVISDYSFVDEDRINQPDKNDHLVIFDLFGLIDELYKIFED